VDHGGDLRGLFFFTQLKLSLFGAIFLAFPVLASQVYMFVAPGLYKNEKQAFLPFLVATPILFILGGSLVYYVVMPLAMKFFLSLQQTGDTQVQIHLTARVSEYLGLVMTLILACERISRPRHDAYSGVRHLLPVAGAADAAGAGRARHC
jgi:Sec-independent protein secretion pathway component TatC